MHNQPLDLLNLKTYQPESRPTIAVIIPCYNEGAAIEETIYGFRKHLTDSLIYVFDNNSTDDTIACAKRAGALVRSEFRQGKGNVVRRMFADVEADLYVLVDGDMTYDPAAAPIMIDKLVRNSLDMVVGCRKETGQGAYRKGHRFGNAVLTNFLAWMFGRAFSDTLSGYRVFSRRFVKTFPSLSNGFEIETEINVHALELRMPFGEHDTVYKERMSGSDSKLSTVKDGIRIITMMVNLFRRERPLAFFSVISGFLLLLAIVMFYPLWITYLHTRTVPRYPTAILCTGLMIMSMLSFVCGTILDTVTHGRREFRRLAYLSLQGPSIFSSAI